MAPFGMYLLILNWFSQQKEKKQYSQITILIVALNV